MDCVRVCGRVSMGVCDIVCDILFVHGVLCLQAGECLLSLCAHVHVWVYVCVR